MPRKKFSIKKGNLYYGGTYCLSLEDQAKLLLDPRFVTPQNIEKIRKYTDEPICNLLLRGLPGLKPEEYQQVENVCKSIFSVIEKLPPYKLKPCNFIYLYRGVKVSFEEAINDKGFMSFTTRYKVCRYFGNNILRIILHYPYEYSIIPLEYITTSEFEYEVLLIPGKGKFYPYGKEEKTIEQKKWIDGIINVTMRTYIYVPITVSSTDYTQDAAKNQEIFDALHLTEEKPTC